MLEITVNSIVRELEHKMAYNGFMYLSPKERRLFVACMYFTGELTDSRFGPCVKS